MEGIRLEASVIRRGPRYIKNFEYRDAAVYQVAFILLEVAP